MGYMTQDTRLFSGKIRDNITYYDKSYSDEVIKSALKCTQVWDMVKMRPNGLDEFVDAGSQNFSGGQKRRLCLARVLLKDIELLLLDEPLVGISPSERDLIIRMLTEELDHTLLLVTHNPDLLDNVDRVIFLKVSDNAETGERVTSVEAIAPHEVLLETNEAYKREFS